MRRFFLFSLLAVTPSAAFAQAERPVIEVRTAFGVSHYLHGDLGYEAPTFLVALRAGIGALAIEPEFMMASQEDTQRFGANTSATTSDGFRSAAVNILGRAGAGVSGYGGGGVGLYWERRRYRLEDPMFGYEQSRTNGPRLGAQLVAGLEIPIVSHVKAFGQFRYEIRSFEDPGGGSVVQGLGGVSIVLR